MSRNTVHPVGGRIGVGLLVVVLLGAGAWLVRSRARTAPARSAERSADAADPSWCGKPLGARAVGQLKDPSTCTKISLTGSEPTCFFWADCGDFHFEIDCAAGGSGQCRCDGEEGRTVPYDPAFCAEDATNPGAGLRAILGSASSACRWSPR